MLSAAVADDKSLAKSDGRKIDRSTVLFLTLKMDVNRYFIITKTCLYNFDPLRPNFYIVKPGFTGVYNIFIISAQFIDCGYWLGSNEYLQSMF